MKPNQANRYAKHILQQQEEQEQNCPPDDPPSMFGEDFDKALGIDKSQLAKPENQKKEEEEETEEEKKKKEEEAVALKKKEEEEKTKIKKPEEKDDDEPVFTRQQAEDRKQKPNKEESVNELKKNHLLVTAELKNYKDLLGDASPETFKEAVEFIKSNIEGPITKDAVVNFLEVIKKAKEEAGTYKKTAEEYEKKLTDMDVRTSRVFQEKYVAPYNDALNTLIFSYAVPGEKEGEFIAPKATKTLNDFLAGDPTKLNQATVVAALRKFEQEFKAESNEEAPRYNVADIFKNIRVFNEKRGSMNGAYDNWKDQKVKDEEQSKVQAASEAESTARVKKAERRTMATEAYNTFEHDTFTDLVPEAVLSTLFQDEWKFSEKFFDKDGEPPKYNDLLKRGIKSRIVDKLVADGTWEKMVAAYKEKLESEKEEEEIPGSGGKKDKTGSGNKVSIFGDFDKTILAPQG